MCSVQGARHIWDPALQVLAHVRGFADAEQDPVHFTTAPAAAIPRALAAAGLAAGDVDFYEARPCPERGPSALPPPAAERGGSWAG